jgi:hypothetical protein
MVLLRFNPRLLFLSADPRLVRSQLAGTALSFVV